jgi:hypothetical protein
MYNKPYVYNFAVSLAGGGSVQRFQMKMIEDFYLFDLAGIETVAQGTQVTYDITNLSRNRKWMNEPTRALLCGVMQPGDSAWMYPVLLKKGEVIEVVAAALAGAPAQAFDTCLVGFHHKGGVPPYCPEPKDVYFYQFDFGQILANATEEITIQIVTGYDYHLLGWTATQNAAALGSFQYSFQDGDTIQWQSNPIPGECLFPNLAANMRRFRLRLEHVMPSAHRVTLTARNLTGGAIADVAIAFYGYHEKASGV